MSFDTKRINLATSNYFQLLTLNLSDYLMKKIRNDNGLSAESV